MRHDELAFLPVSELSQLIERRLLSPVEIVASLLDRIDRLDGDYRHYITVCGERALEAAKAAQEKIASGQYYGPLHGIPVSHKDVLRTAGTRTTAHSELLANHVPNEDATAVARLASAGTIMLGKTNTSEWAVGGYDIHGASRNPWNSTLHTGGSSGGSAGAVAIGTAACATGSDTTGSIRVPSSFSGIVGLKPTFGRVSRYGLIGLCWSTDQIGPMTRTVDDCALMFEAMAGFDHLDSTSSQSPVFFPNLGRVTDLEGVVVGVPEDYFFDSLHPEVDAVVRRALLELESLGCRLEAVNLQWPSAQLSVIGWLIVMVEAYSQHRAELARNGHLYSKRARRRLLQGACYSAADYQKAGQIRELWIRELSETFDQVDALVTPTVAYPAFSLKVQESGPPDVSRATCAFSLSGSPAMSIPCGFTRDGLPVGMQVIASPFDEATLFKIGHCYEAVTRWYLRRPPTEEG